MRETELWDHESCPLKAGCSFLSLSPQPPLIAELDATGILEVAPSLVTLNDGMAQRSTFHSPNLKFTVKFSKSSLGTAGWSLVHAAAYTLSVLGQVLYLFWSSACLFINSDNFSDHNSHWHLLFTICQTLPKESFSILSCLIFTKSFWSGWYDSHF